MAVNSQQFVDRGCEVAVVCLYSGYGCANFVWSGFNHIQSIVARFQKINISIITLSKSLECTRSACLNDGKSVFTKAHTYMCSIVGGRPVEFVENYT